MNTSTIEARRSPGKRLGIFAVAIAVACAGMFGLASSKAEATPTQAGFNMQLNDGYINLGAAFVGQKILPAPAKLGESTVLPDWWDIVDSIAAISSAPTTTNVCTSPDAASGAANANTLFPCGTNPGNALIRANNSTGSTWNPTTGAITLGRVLPTGGGAPWSEALNLDVRFPIMVVPSPLDGDPIPITLAATSAVTGTRNPTTGEVTLTPADANGLAARVLVGLGIPSSAGGPQPFTYCSVPLPSATLSTGANTATNAFTSGSPFTAGPEGSGALQASYTVSADSTPVTQAGLSGAGAAAAAAALEQCGNVNLVSKGSGGIWVGNRTDAPVCKEGEIGVYPDCVVPEANISKIAVTGSSKVKRGKKVSLTVKVTNSGTADKSVKVGIFTSQSGLVKAPGSVTVNAPAGSTGSKKITVTAKKKKGKVTISASNGERTGKRTITVK